MPIFDIQLGRMLTPQEEAARNAAEGLPNPGVPEVVTPLQMRRAIRQAGLKPAVDAFLDGLGEEAQEVWEYASQVRRDDELVAMAAASINMTKTDLDNLFRLAATMTA